MFPYGCSVSPTPLTCPALTVQRWGLPPARTPRKAELAAMRGGRRFHETSFWGAGRVTEERGTRHQDTSLSWPPLQAGWAREGAVASRTPTARWKRDIYAGLSFPTGCRASWATGALAFPATHMWAPACMPAPRRSRGAGCCPKAPQAGG